MKTKIMTVLAAALCLAACMKEKGNYDYQHASDWYPAPLDAGGVGKIHMVRLGEKIFIEPTFANEGVNESDYEYLWYIDREGKRDSIARTLNLTDYQVLMRTGDRPLWLKITNKANGISVTYATIMRVVTDFSQGWFVTKEVPGGKTDVDIVSYDKSISSSNVIAMVNGASLDGTPLRSAFDGIMEGQNGLAGYEYIDAEGTKTIENMLWVLTNERLTPYLADFMTPGLKMDQLFMDGEPKDFNPQDFFCISHNYCKFNLFLNNGQLRWNVGKNSQSTRGHDGQISEVIFPEVTLSPWMCKVEPTESADNDGYNEHFTLLCFDKTSREFRLMKTNPFPSPTQVPELKLVTGPPLGYDDDDEPIVALDPDFDLEWMMEVNKSAGIGLLKKNDGTYWAFDTKKLAIQSNDETFEVNLMIPGFFEGEPRQIPAGRVVSTAKVRTAHKTNRTIFCSAGNNEVYAFQTGSLDEEKIITLPAGESVVFLRDISNTDNMTDFHHLVVLSNDAAGWKLRCYDFVPGTSNLTSATPVQEYSGTGRAVHVFYRGLELGQHCF